MKILITASGFPLFQGKKFLGGIESNVYHIWQGLLSNGFDCWLTGANDSTLEHEKFKRWNIESSIARNIAEKRVRFILSPSYKQWLREMQFDVIIINSIRARLIKQFIISSPHSRFVQVVHALPLFRNDAARYSSLRKIKSNSNLRAITVSETAFNFIERKYPGYLDGYLGNTFYEPSKEYKVTDKFNRDTFLFTGRIMREKNLDFLLDAFIDYNKTLLLIGRKFTNEPSEVEFIKRLETTLNNCSNIIEYKSQDKLILDKITTRSCAMLMPWIHETFCNSAFEAQKLGVPVIYQYKASPTSKGFTHPIGEYVIEGVTGYGLNTYRMSKKRRVSAFRELLEKAGDLDRNKIFEHFKEKYSTRKYLKELLKWTN